VLEFAFTWQFNRAQIGLDDCVGVRHDLQNDDDCNRLDQVAKEVFIAKGKCIDDKLRISRSLSTRHSVAEDIDKSVGCCEAGELSEARRRILDENEVED